MNAADWLPLFPLRTVLFPGGVLPLRVFETRYVDMVRERMKADAPFGVIAIRSGSEIGKAAEPSTVGTLAHIVEWDMPELGVLLLETRGGERFNVIETRVQANQLIVARVEVLNTTTDILCDSALTACSDMLETVISDFMDQAREQSDAAFVNPFPEPHQLYSPGWVANRWSEMLPITLEQKQALLEIQDDGARLIKIEHYLHENRII